jgi:hypothetical protein
MNFDPGQINQLLGNIQYPINKSQLVQMAKQHGLNDQMAGMLEQALPDKQFTSAQDLQSSLSGMMGKMGGNMGDLGNLGNMGGGMKL